jgi:PAS domain S-box-containing protein
MWRPEPPRGDQHELKLICMNNLLASSEVRLYFKDLLSRFTLLSSGWIAAYAPGRTAEELIGKTDFDVFSYTHATAALADEQEIIRTGQPMIGKLEQETYKGRANAWVSTTKMPLRDERGKIIGTFGFTRDVTAYIAAGQPVGKP